MKKNLPVTDTERPFPEGAEVVSATDLKGIITECNDAFVELSGFSREELIGANHNIVRHPDVPPAVFQNLWDTIKQGQAWMGIVKNRCKNGNHYWVDAYVTPMFENGKIIGYESVRSKPTRARVAAAEKLYKDVYANKAITSWLDLTTVSRLGIGALIVLAFIVGVWVFLGSDNNLIPVVAFVLAGLMSAGVIFWATKAIREATREASNFIHNPVLQKLYTGRVNDISSIQLVRYMQEAHLRTALGRVQHLASQVRKHSQVTDEIAQDAREHVNQQRLETDQLATAMEQMSVSISDVADSAGQASDSADVVSQKAEDGRTILDKAAKSVASLEILMSGISDVVNDLHRDADSIGSVTDVIQNIAEQTNLLALNAAIEAARAGEQGRGFAVVADEVRSLATRTAESTQEIRQLIESLQQRVEQVVKVMGEGKEKAHSSSNDTTELHDELKSVLDSVGEIRNRNLVIATAAKEQSVVAVEMSKNVQNINGLSQSTAETVERSAYESTELSNLAEALTSMVQRFRH